MNSRNSYSLRTLRLTAFATSTCPFIEACVADMAYIMNATTGLPESAIILQLQRIWRVNITRIAIGMFVQSGWITGTLLAPDMHAVRTFLGTAGKDCPTRMAVSPDTLSNRLANQILST